MPKSSRLYFLLLMFFLPAQARADHIILAADRWCPINCEPGSTTPGAMIEIAQRIYSAAGHRLEYRIMPWARAIEESRRGKISGIVGAFRGDAPDFIFPEQALLLITSNAFFVTKDSKWRYKDLASLSTVTLAGIFQYDYGNTMNDYMAQQNKTGRVQIIHGNYPLSRNIQKLLLGRVDVVIAAQPVFWHTASQMGVRDKLKYAGQASAAKKCYIALSPVSANSKKYAQLLSDGIEVLRKNGTLHIILQKYGFTNDSMQRGERLKD